MYIGDIEWPDQLETASRRSVHPGHEIDSPLSRVSERHLQSASNKNNNNNQRRHGSSDQEARALFLQPVASARNPNKLFIKSSYYSPNFIETEPANITTPLSSGAAAGSF